MKVKLTVVQGKPEGKELLLPVNPFVIGRGKDCHLRPSSEAIAERHCAIVANNGSVVVRDLTSSGATLLNGKPVQSEQAVESGDLLQVGPLVFAITLQAPAKPAATPTTAAARKSSPSPGDDDVDVADWLGDDSRPAAPTDIAPSSAAPEVPNPFGDFDAPEATSTSSPAAADETAQGENTQEEKPDAKKKAAPQVALTSRAASDILRKYFTRPTE